MRVLLMWLVLNGSAFAADGDACLYGGAPGVMLQGWCKPTPGGKVLSPAAQATCNSGKHAEIKGAHQIVCVDNQ